MLHPELCADHIAKPLKACVIITGKSFCREIVAFIIRERILIALTAVDRIAAAVHDTVAEGDQRFAVPLLIERQAFD